MADFFNLQSQLAEVAFWTGNHWFYIQEKFKLNDKLTKWKYCHYQKMFVFKSYVWKSTPHPVNLLKAYLGLCFNDSIGLLVCIALFWGTYPSMHREKKEQKAAHPRAMLNLKVAEFANSILWKQ